MFLNIVNVLYFLIRLAPFIVVSYFMIQFLFTQDIIGAIYLIGLIAATMMTTILGNYPTFKKTEMKDIPKLCKVVDLTKNGAFSTLPLGQTVLGYTFFFGLYILIKQNLVDDNIGFIVIFSFLILGDLLWNIINKCSEQGELVLSLIVGSICGIFWALLIELTQKETKIDLTKFNNFSTKNSTNCKMNGNTYSCTNYN
jgi:hypothetical protein